MGNVTSVWMAAVLTVGCMSSASAMTGLVKPEPFPDFEPRAAAPYTGAWAITLPTMDAGVPDTMVATCERPVRIEPASETHIFYLGPREKEADAAMELLPQNGGAVWAPIAGGPSFFAIWVSQDMFYLYDEIPQAEADWGHPYVYRRCLAGEN